MSITDFLFSTPPQKLSPADIAILGVFAAFLIIAMFAKLGQFAAARHNFVASALLRRVSIGLFTSGILGAVWAGFRYLSVPYLGIRFVAGLIALGFLIWLYFILAYLFLRFTRERREWEHNQLKQKYLKR